MYILFLTLICLQAIFIQYSSCQYTNYGAGVPNAVAYERNTYNPNYAYAPGIANPYNDPIANVAPGVGVPIANVAPGIGLPVSNGVGLPIEVGYSGTGVGDVAVAGEMPVLGTTLVTGQVPIIGSVRFVGDVPAAGIISLTGTCGCGCGYNNVI